MNGVNEIIHGLDRTFGRLRIHFVNHQRALSGEAQRTSSLRSFKVATKPSLKIF